MLKLKNKTALLLLLYCSLCSYIRAQKNNCDLSVTGIVTCSRDSNPLLYAAVNLLNTNHSAYTDANGKFKISNVCKGEYHIEVFLIGYRKLDTLVNITSSVNLKLQLSPANVHLDSVTIEGQKVQRQNVQTLATSQLSGAQLQQTRGEVLGSALKQITGVDVIQTGPTVVKPVIHGLYSNRILILNNGIPQEDQQWGSDHAPEIDPFIATKLTVIKGAASIRYGSDAIGGVVLVEPADLPTRKSMSGEVNIVGMDNSRMYCGSGILQGALQDSGLSYRFQGTYKRSGTMQAPYYNLDNTATLEEDYSGAIGYNEKHYGASVYYSYFYTEMGIDRNTEAGNPQQLLELFSLNKPLIDSAFTYKIERGYETVDHHLLKTSAFVKYNSFGRLDAVYALQTDSRLEYDLDPAYSVSNQLENAPENDFALTTNSVDLTWEHNPLGNIAGSIGANFMTQGNIYTGLTYAPVIPNYRNYSGGLFMIEKWSPTNNFLLEGGVRYDYKWQREYMLNPSSLKEYTNTQQYNNTSGTLGATCQLSRTLSLDANAGTGWRAPSVYELYAYGIHGATSTFEVGDSTLHTEQSYDFTSSLHYAGKKIEADIGGYINYMYNYIYLQPQAGKPDAIVQTIAGYFPRFDFTQTNALFRGCDLDIIWHITNHLQYEPKVSLIFANDLSNHTYLVLIPPQRFRNTIEYKWNRLWKFAHVFIQVSNELVPRQNRVPPNSDFVPPPPGYTLFSAAVGFSVFLGKQEMSVSVEGANIANTAYRDYLDYFRYYADEPGRNIQLKIRIPFRVYSEKPPQTTNN